MKQFELHAVKEPDGGIRVQCNGDAMDALNAIGSLLCTVSELTGIPTEYLAMKAVRAGKHGRIVSKDCVTVNRRAIESAKEGEKDE